MISKNQIINYVSKNLLEKRNIKVQNEWLDACIEWLQEEYQENGISENRYKDLVYEQWLMSDLREIGSSAFPENILNGTNCKLNGKFMIQINYAYNIGASAYSQLQKIKGCEIPAQEDQLDLFKSAQPSSSNNNNTQGRGKASRLMFLELTDGINTIDAIEYRPIPAMQDEITPGCKIELIGPILYQSGILLLTARNVSVLGGNCEELVTECTQTKIFKSILSLDQDEDKEEEAPSAAQAVQRSENSQLRNDNRQNNVQQSSAALVQPVERNEQLQPRERDRPQGNPVNTASAQVKHATSQQVFTTSAQQVRTENTRNVPNVPKRNAVIPRSEILNEDANEDFFDDDFDFEVNENDDHKIKNGQENELFDDGFDLLHLDDEIEIESFDQKEKPVVSTDAANKNHQSSKSEVFLIDVESNKNIKSFSVKTYVVTLLSKLDMNNSEFQLDVCIDDGSAVLSARISNKVLETMIGYSAKDIADFTKRSLPLPNHVKLAIIRCQQLLATKIWKMDIWVGNNEQLTINEMTQI